MISSSGISTRRNPVPPFTTSKLQQESIQKLRFSAKKTMMVAQQLYEGIDLGPGEPVGLITYMRTDSTRVSDDAIAAANLAMVSQVRAQAAGAAVEIREGILAPVRVVDHRHLCRDRPEIEPQEDGPPPAGIGFWACMNHVRTPSRAPTFYGKSRR